MKNPTKLLLAILATATSGLGLWACQTVVCGTGTVEIDGVCTSEGEPPDIVCGAGSIFNPATGQCEANFCDGGSCGLCDPATSVLEYNDAGVPVCRGTGTGDNCDVEISDCPQGTSNKMQICGRLYDLETSKQLRTGGLQVTFYTALDFASNPNDPGAVLGKVKTDSCGRFSATSEGGAGLTVPGSSFIAVGVDDTVGQADTIRNSGLAVAGVANGRIQALKVFVLSKTTDTAWSTAAFGAGNPTFADRGVYVPIYIDTTQPAPAVVDPLDAVLNGLPTGGVVVTEDGTATAANDFYFSDTAALSRATVDIALNSTGANGTGLYVNGSLVEYSGMGGEPEAGVCKWPSTLAATIPTVVFVQERNSVLVAGGAECP